MEDASLAVAVVKPHGKSKPALWTAEPVLDSGIVGRQCKSPMTFGSRGKLAHDQSSTHSVRDANPLVVVSIVG